MIRNTVSSVMIRMLYDHGVRYIFGVPGEENLAMLDAIRQSPLKLIVTRNEQTAVFMAATWGRLTGVVGVALATLGPGATNMITGVAYAFLGGMPVLVITGQKPAKKSKQGRFQVLDVVSMMKPITKFTTALLDPTRVSATLMHAIHCAQAEKPGPVHLELAEDIADEECLSFMHPLVAPRRSIPDPKAVSQFFSLLATVRTPVLVIGPSANRKRITKRVTQLIVRYNIPFATTQMGKGVVDERLDQSIGTTALTRGDHVHQVLDCSDCIIAIGLDVSEKPAFITGDRTLIHIDFVPTTLTELYTPTMQIVGDIGNMMRQWHDANLSYDHRDHRLLYQKSHKLRDQRNHAYENQDMDGPLIPQYLIHHLRTNLVDDAIVSLDNGLYKVRFARNYLCYQSNTLLLDNALATMGAGYAGAMTAALLYPTRQIVAVVGDGGLMMNLGDLETAVRLGVSLIIIVLNDSAYGMIKRKQKNMGLSDFGLDLTNPDFISLAHSFGITGFRVSKANDFVSTFQHAQTLSGVRLIDCSFVYPDVVGDEE